MEEILTSEQNYVQEILDLIRSGLADGELAEALSDYHENDLAGAFEQLSPEERARLYPILGAEYVSEIFTYIEDPQEYLSELGPEKAAKVIEQMDSDDAVDILEDMDDEVQDRIVDMMDEEASADIRLIRSYDEDEIGSRMTTNFIEIKNTLSVRQAMRELVEQAGKNDNIRTIYVSDENDVFYGAIDLKDLIIARDYTDLDSLVTTSYPYLTAHEKVTDCIERIKDYAEDSLPVLDESGKILGIITAVDIIEAVDDEMGEDYAKLAGLTAEEDLNEKTRESMRKRLPWLVVLLVLGLAISSVVGVFEAVVAVLPVIVSFQSLILDMAGNVGTQSLAVTIRVLMDENLAMSQKMELALKEVRVGLCNGLVLGIVTFLALGLYLHVLKGGTWSYAFLIAGCVSAALLASMIISSLVGTVVPMIFHSLKVDPAVASGPLITTVNDLVAILTYYGLAWVLLINVCHLG
ncbi:MAG: magnesium transporter [Lachnospiraceae bacterium]|nr:magnesium transporter [Lachnospiraceae bacterium]